MNKFELTQKAKKLIPTDPKKSLKLYSEALEKWGDNFDEWDAFFLVRAMKESNSYNSKLLKSIYRRFNTSEKVTSQILWMYYDREIKGISVKELRQKEGTINKILNVGFQKDFRNAENDYACPYSEITLKMADAFDERGLNNSSNKIIYWLEKLEPTKLSKEPNSFKNKEYASPFEKFYSKRTKARLDTERYSECLEDCETVLNTISVFHNDADIWIKRRKALCKYHLGAVDQAIEILESLLEHSATDKWFVKAEIADCYLAEKDYENAIKCGCEAALDEKNYSFKVKLFRTLSEAFDGMGEYEIGRSHALLIKSIIEEEDWSVKESHKELFDKFEIFDNEVANFKEILAACKDHWTKQQFAGQEKKKGIIKVIHGSGKSGHIEDDVGSAYFFPLFEVKSKPGKQKKYEGATVEFYLKDATDQNGNPEHHATNINIVEWREVKGLSSKLEVGATYKGIVKNIKNFGVFVKILEHNLDGLVHKNILESRGNENLLTTLSPGDEVEVEVTRITKKGPDLDIVQVI